MLKRIVDSTPISLTRGIKTIARITPFVVEKHSLELCLKRVFHEAIAMDELDFWQGRFLAIHIVDLNKRWVIEATPTGFCVYDSKQKSEATISGNLKEFALLAMRKEDPDTLFFHRRLNIEGDTELSLGVKNLIDGLDGFELSDSLNKVLEKSLRLL
ncbi:MAG: putative lipid carrier protein YhbT [Flavobacteriales bacterium]|jgi:predicted lipid carrier protein YhbT